jgi:small ligand-binding sensory domain FIST
VAHDVHFVSALSDSAAAGVALDDTMARVDAELRGAPDLALVFAAGRCASGFDRIGARLARAWPGAAVAGASALSLIGGGRELEDRSGLALFAARLGDTRVRVSALEPGSTLGAHEGAARPSFVLLADPFSFDTEALLHALDVAWPERPKLGGLASGGRAPGQNALLAGERVLRGGAVALELEGELELDAIVAQGCRPIGTPLFVTAAHDGAISALDGRPPLEVVQELYDASPREDQALFRGSLFLGIAMREGETQYAPGDFLVRNLVGVDPERRTLAVGARIASGAVVQFHLRDARASRRELESALGAYRAAHAEPPRAALLFSCLGRGSGLYGEADVETRAFERALPRVPLAGFFCNGEIGPVRGRSFLHGYTSAFALFRRTNRR